MLSSIRPKRCIGGCIVKFISMMIIFRLTEAAILLIVPERVDFKTYSGCESMVENITLKVGRNGRRSPYVLNITFDQLVPAHNNVTMNISFLEYRSNEYRRGIFELSFRLCDYLEKGLWHEEILRKVDGLKSCPVHPGRYAILNIFKEKFYLPSNMPISKACLQVIFFATKTDKPFILASVYISIKDVTNARGSRRKVHFNET